MKTEGVEAVPLNDRVTMLRGVCNERLKFEIEYGLRRGTTDNSYIVKVQRRWEHETTLHAAHASQAGVPHMLRAHAGWEGGHPGRRAG